MQKIYIVKPPVGRFHESLWEIAENHLGNGLRYREIFDDEQGPPAARRDQADHRQPDQARLGTAHAA